MSVPFRLSANLNKNKYTTDFVSPIKLLLESDDEAVALTTPVHHESIAFWNTQPEVYLLNNCQTFCSLPYIYI